MIRTPQYGYVRVAQLLQIPGDHIHLRAPALIKTGAGSQHFAPFEIGEMALHALVESDRLIVGRPHGVPGERNDSAVAILAHSFFHQRRARQRGVLILAALKAKVLSENGWILTGKIVGAIGPASDGPGSYAAPSGCTYRK